MTILSFSSVLCTSFIFLAGGILTTKLTKMFSSCNLSYNEVNLPPATALEAFFSFCFASPSVTNILVDLLSLLEASLELHNDSIDLSLPFRRYQLSSLNVCIHRPIGLNFSSTFSFSSLNVFKDCLSGLSCTSICTM